VVEPAVVAQGEHAAGVDLVVADAVVGVVQGQAGRDGLGPGLVGLDRGAPAEGAVGRWVLSSPRKVSSWAWSCPRVRARDRVVSHFLRVWWNRSTLPQVWGGRAGSAATGSLGGAG
jgi:hypothetical protein